MVTARVAFCKGAGSTLAPPDHKLAKREIASASQVLLTRDPKQEDKYESTWTVNTHVHRRENTHENKQVRVSTHTYEGTCPGGAQ